MKLKSLCFLAALMAIPLIAQEAAPVPPPPPPDAPAAVQPPPPPPPPQITPEQAEAKVKELLAVIPEVVATYKDGEELKGADICKELKPQLIQAIQAGYPVEKNMITGIARQLASNLIQMKLAGASAKEKGFVGNPEEAKKQLDLVKQNAGPQFEAILKTTGMTEEELLKKIEELDGIQAYLDSMVKLPEKAAENFYKEHVEEFFTQLSASHILAQFPKDAPVTEEAKQATKERILAIQKELKDGKDFAELAKEKSDCPSKEDGGNLGSFSKGQMVPAFEAALLEMKPGEISDIVETEFGYHIIKAGETKVVPFEEVKERIEEHLKQEAEQEVAETTFTKLLEEAKIKWNLPEPEFPKDEEEEAPAEE